MKNKRKNVKGYYILPSLIFRVWKYVELIVKVWSLVWQWWKYDNGQMQKVHTATLALTNNLIEGVFDPLTLTGGKREHFPFSLN